MVETYTPDTKDYYYMPVNEIKNMIDFYNKKYNIYCYYEEN